MGKESMITLPIKEGNLMIAKAEALDALIDNGIVDKATIVNIGSDDWYGEYLANKWEI